MANDDSDFQSLAAGIAFRAIELPGSVAFQFRDDTSGATALFAPSVGELHSATARLQFTHLILSCLTGRSGVTENSVGVRPGARSAREMNHLPINNGSFDLLHQSQAHRKIYIAHQQHQPDSDAWPPRTCGGRAGGNRDRTRWTGNCLVIRASC